MKFPEMPFRAASGSEHGWRTEKPKGGHFVRWIANKNKMLLRSSCARTRAFFFLLSMLSPTSIVKYINMLPYAKVKKKPSICEKKTVTL